MPRLTAASILVLALALTACAHRVSERDRERARNYYELALQLQATGDVVSAYKELEKSIAQDPYDPASHNVAGVLLHLSFDRPQEAEKSFKRAIELDGKFSEAHTNLGNLYLDQGRYDDAIGEYRQALANMLYETPFIAQGNLGWALYKKGQVEEGVNAIKAAVATNPQFCQGFRNLGIIHDEQSTRLSEQGQDADARRSLEEALRYFGRYREACPKVADAYLRAGLVEAKLGQADKASDSFAQCEALATGVDLKDRCRSLAEKLR